jgi:WD40 repeat protein
VAPHFRLICLSQQQCWKRNASVRLLKALVVGKVLLLQCLVLLFALQVRIELYDRKQTRFISAHNTPLVSLALSMDGKRLATASDKGTLVRVWNSADGQLLQVGQQGGRSWSAEVQLSSTSRV